MDHNGKDDTHLPYPPPQSPRRNQNLPPSRANHGKNDTPHDHPAPRVRYANLPRVESIDSIVNRRIPDRPGYSAGKPYSPSSRLNRGQEYTYDDIWIGSPSAPSSPNAHGHIRLTPPVNPRPLVNPQNPQIEATDPLYTSPLSPSIINLPTVHAEWSRPQGTVLNSPVYLPYRVPHDPTSNPAQINSWDNTAHPGRPGEDVADPVHPREQTADHAQQVIIQSPPTLFYLVQWDGVTAPHPDATFLSFAQANYPPQVAYPFPTANSDFQNQYHLSDQTQETAPPFPIPHIQPAALDKTLSLDSMSTSTHSLFESQDIPGSSSLKEVLLDVQYKLILTVMFRMPLLYFSRVVQIVESADLTLTEMKWMYLNTARFTLSFRRGLFLPYPERRTFDILLPVYSKFQDSWETFIQALLKEWKTFNIISALLMGAILTLFQIPGVAEDPTIKFLALLSLLCALISLLFGCVYIVRFGTMKKTYIALEWALEAQKLSNPFWNVWTLLAMPAIWLTWSLGLFLSCIFSFVWRTIPADGTGPRPQWNDELVLAARISFTATFAIAVCYGVCILRAFRKWGTKMEREWLRRIREWGATASFNNIVGQPASHTDGPSQVPTRPATHSEADELTPAATHGSSEPSNTVAASSHSSNGSARVTISIPVPDLPTEPDPVPPIPELRPRRPSSPNVAVEPPRQPGGPRLPMSGDTQFHPPSDPDRNQEMPRLIPASRPRYSPTFSESFLSRHYAPWTSEQEGEVTPVYAVAEVSDEEKSDVELDRQTDLPIGHITPTAPVGDPASRKWPAWAQNLLSDIPISGPPVNQESTPFSVTLQLNQIEANYGHPTPWATRLTLPNDRSPPTPWGASITMPNDWRPSTPWGVSMTIPNDWRPSTPWGAGMTIEPSALERRVWLDDDDSPQNREADVEEGSQDVFDRLSGHVVIDIGTGSRLSES